MAPMGRFGNIFFSLMIAISVSGCGPTLNSSTAAGNCPKAAVSFAADAFPQGQQRISTTQSVAQSFILNPGETLSGVSLRLEGFSPTIPSSLFGLLNVYIVPDSSGGATPTQPNCSPANSASGCADQAVMTGSLNLNTITINVPKYYNVPLTGSLAFLKSANQARAYWIVVATSYVAGSTSYVVWDGSGIASPTPTGAGAAPRSANSSPVGALVTTTTFYNVNWTPSGQNMTAEVCR